MERREALSFSIRDAPFTRSLLLNGTTVLCEKHVTNRHYMAPFGKVGAAYTV